MEPDGGVHGRQPGTAAYADHTCDPRGGLILAISLLAMAMVRDNLKAGLIELLGGR